MVVRIGETDPSQSVGQRRSANNAEGVAPEHRWRRVWPHSAASGSGSYAWMTKEQGAVTTCERSLWPGRPVSRKSHPVHIVVAMARELHPVPAQPSGRLKVVLEESPACSSRGGGPAASFDELFTKQKCMRMSETPPCSQSIFVFRYPPAPDVLPTLASPTRVRVRVRLHLHLLLSSRSWPVPLLLHLHLSTHPSPLPALRSRQPAPPPP